MYSLSRLKKISAVSLIFGFIVTGFAISHSLPSSAAGAPAQITTAPAAVAGDKSATITWKAPLDNGSAITSYTATSTPGNLSCTTASLSCVVSGLSNETQYVFTVVATNQVGNSSPSVISNSVLPTHVPLEEAAVRSQISGIHKMVLDPSGAFAYIITRETGRSRLLKYEITSGVIRESMVFGSSEIATQIIYDSTNSLIFVSVGINTTSSTPGNYLYKFDARDFSFITSSTASGTLEAFALTPDGTYLIGVGNLGGPCGAYQSKLSKIRISDLTVVAETTSIWGSSAKSIFIKNNYAYFYTSFTRCGTFSYTYERLGVVSLSPTAANPTVLPGGSASENYQGYGFPIATTINSQGNLIAIMSDGTLIKTNLANSTTSLVTSVSNFYGVGAFSSDGRFAYVPGYLNGPTPPRIYKIDTISQKIIGFQELGASSFWPIASALSSDGSYLYLASSDVSGQISKIYLKDVPSSPLNVTGAFANGAVQVSWEAPIRAGISQVTNFRVVATPGGKECITTSNTCQVSGLNNGVGYSFKVYPSNPEGSGIPSAQSAVVVPATKPSEPVSVQVVRGPRQATVSWSPSIDDGGSSVTYQVVVASPSGSENNTCSTSETSCVVSGLSNGVSYRFRVIARNKAGESASSVSGEAIPRSVPDPPTGILVNYGNARATIAWLAPTDTGGLEIEGFRVTSNPGDKSCEASGAERGCEISGLTNGVSYTFSVVAVNSLGSSAPAVSLAVTPRTKPEAPTLVSVVPGNGEVQVTWTAPTSTGGAPILRYTAQSIENGRNCTTANGTTLTCLITGLTNGQSYSFTVKASNSEGQSPESATSISVIPRTVPGAPTEVTGTFGNASATISWTPPVDNGGASLVSHTVYFANTNTFACLVLAPENSCVVTGLLNGSSYTFYVRANNVAGAGGQSLVSPSITPATIPGAPVIFSVSASGNGQVSLAWSVTTVLGGSPITGHTVTAIPITGETKMLEVPYPSGSNSAVLTGLTTGVTYSFSVKTKNKAGSSVASAAWALTPQAAPGAPTNILAFPGDRSVTVRWTPPLDNGGAAITSYEVRNAVTNALVCTSVGIACTTGTSLTNGSSYSFKVFALNGTPSLFTSVASETSAPVVPRGVPLAPSSTTAIGGDSSAAVSWLFADTLINNRGSSVSSFIVYAQDLLGVTKKTCETSNASERSCMVTGLTNGLTYKFRVAAVNAAGVGALSTASLSVVPDLAPEAPSIISTTYGDQKVTVAWSLTQNNGSTNSQVTVIASPGGKYCTVAASTTSCAITGLTNGTNYTFTVRARNVSLEGPASPSSVAVMPRSIPSAPTLSSATPGNNKIAVVWSHANTSGLPILGYVAKASPGNLTCTTTTLQQCEILGLTNGTSYVISLTAINEEGTSPSSVPSGAITPRTFPAAPEFTSSTYGSGRVTLEWSTPESDGGSAITGYVITQVQSGVTRTYSAPAAARNLTIPSLTNGLTYTFKISAQNIAGLSLISSESVTVTPWGPPAAPSPISVAPRDSAVLVSWSHPVNTDPESTTYVVTASPGGQTCEVTGETSCVVTGLTNGYPYSFSVIATNYSGSSSRSPSSINITPAAVPGAPTDVVAEIGRLSAFVYWIAPIDNGGAPIIKYTVSASGSDKTCVSATTSCQIKGLSQGVSYTFTVKATNAAGEGPASDASAPLLIGQVPDAPNSIFGISGPSQVTVSWGEPANGGSEIDSYLVTSTPGGFICKSNGLLSCTIGGLANNVSYTFTVKAFNSLGGSDNSIASAPVTPRNIPGQPSDISSFFQTPTSLLVVWTPVVNLSNPVTKYQVDLLEPNYPFEVIQSIDVDSNALSVSFSGLTPGAAYRVQVTALSMTEEELGVVSLSAQNSALPAMLRPGSIGGTASRGSVLTLNSGDWIGNPLPVVSRTWFRCNNSSSDLVENLPFGCFAISGATSLTYTPTATDVGKYILAGVKVSNSAGFVLVYTGTTSIIKAPPALSKAQMISGSVAVGASLVTTLGSWQGSPLPEITIQWQRCTSKLAAGAVAQNACQNIEDATLDTYVISASDVGKFIRSAIVATNDGGSVASYSATTATAPLQRPTLIAAPSISGSAMITGTLVATAGSWSASPTPTYTYAWYRCVEPVQAANSSCAVITGASTATYKPAALDIGKFLAIAVKAKNSAGEAVGYSASTLAVRSTPTLTLAPKVTGTFAVGNVISTTLGSWSGYPVPELSVIWQRCTSSITAGNRTAANCETIDGATDLTYQLVNEDTGKYLRSIVTAVNDGASVRSTSATGTQILKRPSLLESASILGPSGFKARATLTATNGSWSGLPTISFRQQWYRCADEVSTADELQAGCVAITGANKNTYVPTLADVGFYLVVGIEAKNSVATVNRFTASTIRITQ